MNLLGTPMLIRLTGRDTDGTESVVESRDSPEGGPPPHIHHREDETFQILEGEYEFTVAGKPWRPKQATRSLLRAASRTRIAASARPRAKLSVVITPAGFEGFFEELGALPKSQQPDLLRVLEIGRKYGLEFLPPA